MLHSWLSDPLVICDVVLLNRIKAWATVNATSYKSLALSILKRLDVSSSMGKRGNCFDLKRPEITSIDLPHIRLRGEKLAHTSGDVDIVWCIYEGSKVRNALILRQTKRSGPCIRSWIVHINLQNDISSTISHQVTTPNQKKTSIRPRRSVPIPFTRKGGQARVEYFCSWIKAVEFVRDGTTFEDSTETVVLVSIWIATPSRKVNQTIGAESGCMVRDLLIESLTTLPN
mmetsp:Transcript_19240/g.31975  ORF Transcript_19240/g.31975 Transcript_19240/m.31975 type:complete len:229 (-) Transcript_19240:255-941(-)